jgi:DNA primase
MRYLHDRGLSDITAEAFGIGYAPSSGTAFVNEARSAGLDLATCEKAGLVRHSDDGRPYDFFRGRLMIPIRDLKGRTVGFGARRLVDEDASGPKYINTGETELFHKGRLVYALDRALPNVRKSAHIVLVEGYTDVMAAHQCGVGNVVAVLGTATTDDHAALIRRTGARKISLVFDGDEAGRKASYKALHGLLPLDAEIDVVSLTGGDDPCDFLVREGGAAFLARVEMARGWFDFLLDGARGKRGIELSREVDRILELLSRIQKPVHRDACIAELARALDLPASGVHAQYSGLPGQQAARRAARGSARGAERDGASASVAASASAGLVEADREIVAACEELLGTALLDAGLCPALRALIVHCEDVELRDIQAAMDALYLEEREVTPSAVATMLGDAALEGKGSLARLWKILPPPIEAEDPRDVGFEIQDRFKSALQRLENRLIQREEAALTARMVALDEAVLDGRGDASHEQQLAQVRDAFAQIRARKAQLGTQSTVRPQTARK